MRNLIESTSRETGVRGGAYPSRMPNAADSEGPSVAAPAEIAVEQRPSVTAATVLVIEDEPGIVDFVRRGLQAEGFSVESAGEGEQGERLALRGGYDAIVLDLMLPGRG